MKCHKCNNEISDDAIFCSNCGTKVKEKKSLNNKFMNKKIIGIAVALLFLAVGVSALLKSNSSLSENDILENLPVELKTIYVDDIPWELDAKSIDITKRKTEDDFDTVYGTLITENDVYECTADIVLYYSYYDEGGWILDSWEKIDSYTQLKGALSKEESDYEMGLYYFDSYEFKDSEFNETTNISNSVYDVEYVSNNYSYKGEVVLESIFYSSYEGGNWDKTLKYSEDFVWNVNDCWAAADEDLNTSRSFHKTAFEIEISEINQEKGTVLIDATEYYDERTYSTDAMVIDSIVVDYTGVDYIRGGLYITASEEDMDYLKYNAPTLSFEFNLDESRCVIRISPDTVHVNLSGRGGVVSGDLYQGYYILSSEDNYGYTQFDKVSSGSEIDSDNEESDEEYDEALETSERFQTQEEKIEYIREVYSVTKDNLDEYEEEKVKGLYCRHYDQGGAIRRITLYPPQEEFEEISDINDYVVEYYYDNTRVAKEDYVFAYVCNNRTKEKYRFYIFDEELIRYIDPDGEIYEIEDGDIDVDIPYVPYTLFERGYVELSMEYEY